MFIVFGVLDPGPTARANVRDDLSTYAVAQICILMATHTFFTRLERIKHEPTKTT
jgi:hypothetical protein